MPEATGIVQNNPMNNIHGKHTHNYSFFPDSLAYRHYMTARFGEYTPSFVMDGVPKDEISLNARHIIDSLSLNSPFKGSVRKITESFMVPNMAILPLNWDRIYAQPANGDDVPKDANCVLQGFPERFSTFWKHQYDLVYANFPDPDTAASADALAWTTAFLRMMIVGEYIYSAGSLASVCGYHGNAQIELNVFGKTISYDSWFDQILNAVFSCFDSLTVIEPVGSSTRLHFFKGLSGNEDNLVGKYESFRSMIELFRENPLCYFSDKLYSSTISTTAGYDTYLAGLKTDASGFPIFPDPDASLGQFGINFILPAALEPDVDTLTDMSQRNFNLSRILAYQLVCAHYYTNSSVDFVYSAELFRQYVFNLVAKMGDYDANHAVFSWNGIQCPYDYLSGRLLQFMYMSSLSVVATLDYATISSPYSAANPNILKYALFAVIFGFRKSLRFGDYFVGCRPRPLAPINTDVSVNSNLVSVIDITRSIQAQRFANSVMRSRSKIENYVRDLFGKSPAPDFHNPFFLVRQAELIYGDEVQNTGEAQTGAANSRTANFKSGDGRFTFTFHNDDAHPCIYLQIVSFDIRRAYTRSIDRHFMHLDRFDMFNPDFQYIGDQPIYGYELGYPLADGQTIPAVFGYQGRDMEYKQRFDVASGGFCESLRPWILTDVDRSKASIGQIDPDFIRSYNSEFDQFFLSLSGFSLASYFHFIMVVNNNVSAKRPMSVDPQILE